MEFGVVQHYHEKNMGNAKLDLVENNNIKKTSNEKWGKIHMISLLQKLYVISDASRFNLGYRGEITNGVLPLEFGIIEKIVEMDID